jgi:hypothetical protein
MRDIAESLDKMLTQESGLRDRFSTVLKLTAQITFNEDVMLLSLGIPGNVYDDHARSIYDHVGRDINYGVIGKTACAEVVTVAMLVTAS